jgi:hypothetical protein
MLDHLFARHKSDGFTTVRWTREKVIAEGRRYETRRQFALGSASTYYAALREGWDADACAHMRIVGNQSWRAVYAIKAAELRVAYIGISHDPEMRYRQHRNQGKKAIRSFTNNIPQNGWLRIATSGWIAFSKIMSVTDILAFHALGPRPSPIDADLLFRLLPRVAATGGRSLVSAMLGHADLKTTSAYAHGRPGYLKTK